MSLATQLNTRLLMKLSMTESYHNIEQMRQPHELFGSICTPS
jgi:hypothetical protein